jgi:molecular chaperone HscB
MVRCASCERAQEPRLLCCECGSPLAAELDYFAVFELPRKLSIDSSKLAERYHELGRRIHPDRFANAPAKVRAASLSATALLTRAYRALNDPVARGRYWLELNGEKLSAGNQQVPGELAAMVFEAQEAIAALREAGAGAAEKDAVREYRATVAAESADAKQELERIFAAFDEEQAESRAELFERLKAVLARIAYLETLNRDLTKALDIRAAA